MSEISQIKKILLLSTVFSLGCVLVILSCTQYNNWSPLLSLLMFVLAPAPGAFLGQSSSADIMSDTNDTAVDFGRFLTSIFLVSAYALPIIFAHSGMMAYNAVVMSLIGGSLIYGTIITFGAVFASNDEY